MGKFFVVGLVTPCEPLGGQGTARPTLLKRETSES